MDSLIVKQGGVIKGFSLCRGGPELTHLLFANDSLLFCRATSEECEKVLQILESYEQASGQKVNRNKTAIFLSKATPDTLKQAIKTTLGLQEITEYENTLACLLWWGGGKKRALIL